MNWRTFDPRKPVRPVNTKYSWPKLSRFERISGVKNMCRFYTSLSCTFWTEGYPYSLLESKAELKVFRFRGSIDVLSWPFYAFQRNDWRFRALACFKLRRNARNWRCEFFSDDLAKQHMMFILCRRLWPLFKNKKLPSTPLSACMFNVLHLRKKRLH